MPLELVHHYHLQATGSEDALATCERQPEAVWISHFLRCPATDPATGAAYLGQPMPETGFL